MSTNRTSSTSNKKLKTINPATEEVLNEYELFSKEQLNDTVVNTDARKSIITFQPLGVIGSIMPWNFPYWQGLRFAAPSLMVGNTIVLKPASATMQCGIEIEKTFGKAGAPQGVFQTIVGDSSIAETLVDSDGI